MNRQGYLDKFNNRLWIILLVISIALFLLIIIKYQNLQAPIIVFSISYGILILAFFLFSSENKQKFHKQNRKILEALKIFSSSGVEKQKTFIQKHLKGELNSAFLEMNESINGHFLSVEERLVNRSARITQQNEKLRQKQKEILVRNNELQSAYEALMESRQKYEKLIVNLEDEYFFFSYSTKGEVLFVSPSIKRILGFAPKEYREKHNSLFTDNPMNTKARESKNKSLEGIQQQTYLMELFDSSNKPHIFEVSEVPVINDKGDIVSVEGLAHDISERKIAEEKIKEQEEKYRGVFNYASDFVFLYQLNDNGTVGKFIEANRFTLNKLSYNEEELYAKTPVDLAVSPEGIDQEIHPKKEKYERIWESREGIFITVEISEHAIRLNGKKSVIAVARDITERKRALEEIRFMNEELINQKENLEALIDNLTQTQEQLVQSEKMAALGQLIAGVAHEINTPLGAIKASAGNMDESLNLTVTDIPDLIKNKTKEEVDLFIKFYLRSSKEKDVLSSREKRQKKRELRSLLEDAGIEPADIIADSFIYMQIFHLNDEDIITLKKTNPQSILKAVKNFISIRKNTNNITLAADKAAKVVFALKKYAHRDSLGEKVPTDIIDGIDTVLTLYNNQMKQGIEIVKNYQEIPTVMCYQDELSQVWTNLIQNALQAMNYRGTLTIDVWEQTKHVLVSIKDTGPGVEQDVADKIFDPFFTTKKQGEGSGLGLDIVKKIIDKHAGNIELQSEIGNGAKFIVKLPIQ